MTEPTEDIVDRPSPVRGSPAREQMSAATRRLHAAVDARMRRSGRGYLHPKGETIALDLLGSDRMIAWQEEKARLSFLGESCWSAAPAVYGRYGTESSRRLLERVRELEQATAVVLTDSGMQALALLFDVLLEPGDEAVLARVSYNKTKTYVRRLTERLGGRVTLVEDGSLDAFERAITERTRFVFAETYSNPLLRALDVPGLVARVARARERENNPRLRVVVDNTVATPWGANAPLLEWGVDFVVASGTKALDGRDRNMWGYVASRRPREMNDVMDLQAMRGGILDWRRAEDVASGLEAARRRFERRCRTAERVAAYLEDHRAVAEVHHPSLPSHPDASTIRRDYRLPGSLLSFRLRDADEDATRRFCDVLAMTRIARYALSFDGLVTKVNHHRSVSEHFTPEDELSAMDVDRLVRLAIGLESAEDLVRCLGWALESYRGVDDDQLTAWRRERERELGLPNPDAYGREDGGGEAR